MNSNQLSHRIGDIYHNEDLRGIMTRITRRFMRRPLLFSHAYALTIYLKDLKIISLQDPDFKVKELAITDDDDIDAVAKFGFYGRSRDDIKQYLSEHQRCFIVKYKDQVVSCYWSLRKDFYDYRNYRQFYLADNEIYLLGAFTLPEFRGKGILPYLTSQSLLMQFQDNMDIYAVLFIDIHNKASLHTVHKLGFLKAGRVGFIDIFGIRLQYLMGKNVLLKTKPRTYLEISKLA